MSRAILCLLAGLGCASASSGPWREVSTPHFVVRTDYDADTARRAAAVLELDRDLVLSAAWPNMEIPEWTRSEVYMLSDGIEFESYFGQTGSVSVAGVPQQFFLYGTPERWEPRWMPTQAPNSVLRYHLALRMAWLIYPEAPAWFLIGVAQFIETVHPSEDGGSLVLGGVNSQALAAYRRFRSVTLDQVLAYEREDPKADEDWGRWGMAWLFVHWLSNVHPEPFTRYRAELMRGTDARLAFRHAFPDFDSAATDAELNRYSQHPGHVEITAPLRRSQVALQERLLTPSDLHVLRARITSASWAFGARKIDEATMKAEVRAQVDEAIALDPKNVDALAIDDWSPPAQRLARARAAAAAHPDDARAWVLIAKADESGREQEGAYRKALALAPNDPQLMNDLAWVLQAQGRWSQAMPLAMKAVKRVPTEAFYLDTYAAVMFKAGSCTNALGAQEKAVARLSSQSRKAYPDITQRLDDYRIACAQRRPRR